MTNTQSSSRLLGPLASLCLWISFAVSAFFGSSEPARAQTTTQTTLAVTYSGSTITSVPSGNAVTLTATVTSGGTPVTTGQVNFCDATVTSCTDIHLLGTAQLIHTGTAAGTALLSLHPGIGSHSYKAIFAGTPGGTPAYASSTSSNAAFGVSGSYKTSTSISTSGSLGKYNLSATVNGLVNKSASPGPSGAVVFQDTSQGNLVTNTATLSASTMSLGWTALAPTAANSYGSTTVSDVNGDGNADLILLPLSSSGDLAVYLGKGDGTFNTPIFESLPAAQTPFANTLTVQVADFNMDGKPDVAVGLNDGRIVILLGNGDGTFVQSVSLPPLKLSLLTSFVVGDFNGDGVPDLAIIEQGGLPSPLIIALGNGDGTFKMVASNIQAPLNDVLGAPADFNGDGRLDLVEYRQSSGSGTSQLTVLLSDGDGTFTAAQSLPSGYFGFNFEVAADFNGDGKLDLAISDENSFLTSTYGGQDITIYLGNGDGTFAAAPGGPIYLPYAGAMAVADFNADGQVDLVANSFSQSYTVLLGDGDGTFHPTVAVPALGAQAAALVADFNNDGLPDYAFFLAASGLGLQVNLTQLTQSATASVTGVSVLGTGTHLIDAMYPGDSSFAASTSGTVSLAAQQVKPTVSVTPSSAAATALAFGVTVAVSGPSGDPTPTGTVTLSSGSFTSPAATLSGGIAVVTVSAGSLPAGNAALTVSYSGDGNYLPSTGSASVTVVASSFTISGTAVSVLAGTTAGDTSTVSITPVGGFSGTVALSATVTSSPANAQLPPIFSFGATSPIILTGTGGGTAILTIATTSPAVCGVPTNESIRARSKTLRNTLGGGAVACVLLCGFGSRRRRWLSMLSTLALLLTFTCGITACGGNNANGSKPTCNVATPGTTPGTYAITVTGTSGAATATTTLMLAVH